MNEDRIKEGERLASDANDWWKATLPMGQHADHQDEAVPKLVRWVREALNVLRHPEVGDVVQENFGPTKSNPARKK